MHNFKKGFTLIDLLIVTTIIGILSVIVIAVIVIVTFPEPTDRARAHDASVRLKLSSLYVQGGPLYNVPSKGLCENNQVQRVFDTIFNVSTDGVLTTLGNQKFYTTSAVIVGTKDIKNGCISTLSSWVAWADLSTLDGAAYCVDSGGYNGQIDTNDDDTDIYKVVVSQNGVEEIACTHLEENS